MKDQKDNVLNLFYLFNEGDLYKIEGDLLSLDTNGSLTETSDNHVGEVATSVEPIANPPLLETEAESQLEALPNEKIAEIITISEVESPAVDPVVIQEKALPMAVIDSITKPDTSIVEPQPMENTHKTTPALPIIPEPSIPTLVHTIFLVISEAQTALLNTDDKAFLEKVLQAVEVSLEQVSLINVNGVPDPDYHYIFREKQVRQFISFGVPMEDLNLYLPLVPYEVKLLHGIHFLYTDNLEGIRTNVERKKWLWTALKQMFGMK